MNEQKNGMFFKGMIAGGLVGAAMTLFHKETRENVAKTAEKCTANTFTFAKLLRENPSNVANQMKDISANVKSLVSDISDDVRDVIEKVNEVKQDSEKTYRSVQEAGEELKDIGTRLKGSGESIIREENTDNHQQL